MPDKKRNLSIVEIDYKTLAAYLGIMNKEIIGAHVNEYRILLYMVDKDD